MGSVRRCVVLPYGDVGAVEDLDARSAAFPRAWRAAAIGDYAPPKDDDEVVYERGGFDAASYVMFSSGTTGAPKCMVQGPGVALNHAKEAALHWDVRRGDRALWYTTTGWMMWNWLLGASLTTGACGVLLDGDAMYDGATRSKRTAALFECADRAGVRVLGGSARYYGACAAEDVKLPPLKQLEVVGSTGSPCPPSAYAWLHWAFWRGVSQRCSKKEHGTCGMTATRY